MKRSNSNKSDLDFLKVIYNYLKSWYAFLIERFSPISHIPMILLFCFGTATFVDQKDLSIKLYTCLYSFIFFLRLRLFDEIKDYELDIKINPHRPLPRGLLTIHDMKFAIIVCIIAEYSLVYNYLPHAYRFWVIATIWSLFMYKEFFIPQIIRRHLTTYALTHTLVTIPLTLSLINGMSEVETVTTSDFYVATASWFVFNIFEFGRKTYQPIEEKNNIESYSKVWGRTGAVVLVNTQSLLAVYLFTKAYPFFTTSTPLYIPSILLVFVSLYYLLDKTRNSGAIYRASSSIFIIGIYLLLTILPFIGSSL